MLHASGLVPARFLCIIGNNSSKKYLQILNLFRLQSFAFLYFRRVLKGREVVSSSFSFSGEKLVVTMPNTGRQDGDY
jgi:hypothetical protein